MRFLIALLLLPTLCLANDGALEQLNKQRQARGLRPYLLDPNLQAGAEAAASYRAKCCIEGHTSNDFQFLPKGTSAAAAGCAAWRWSGEFGACACYDNYTYAGAGWYTGRDGRVYCHLFVR